MKLDRFNKKASLEHFYFNGLVAGCDEAGRGCLAGPVFAAAVILKKSFKNDLLNDSKLLSSKSRASLRKIIEAEAIEFAVSKVSERQIDKINILNASFRAMHLALSRLKSRPELILVDGNRFNSYKNIEHRCVIKGDAKYYSIAAASILAKEYRDDYMRKLSKKFPEYSWNSNKGYPTALHRSAIQSYGTTPYHRMSFQLLPHPEQLKLFDKKP